MLTHAQLLARLQADPHAAPVVAVQDRKDSISSKVVRCRHEGWRAVAVGADTDEKTKVDALVDLLDLHLHAPAAGVDPERVVLLLGGAELATLDALGTLVASMTGGPDVQVLLADDDGTLVPLPTAPCDFSTAAEYPSWLDLLMAVEAGPPALLRTLVGAVAQASHPTAEAVADALRAYQMLSLPGSWSLRLEGLEVGRVKGAEGRLDVGRTSATGATSPQRSAWLTATGGASPVSVTPDPAAVGAAAQVLVDMATALWGAAGQGKQDEHALESRVLRGLAPVVVPGVGRLQLLRDDAAVNWGSQFPTKWGRQGPARYLDALLRDGTTPWAVEIKIQGGTGVGGYYRHAVSQAVLYRHFIREAAPLDPWFARFDLDRATCRAAVLVPTMSGPQLPWRTRLQAVADLFDVALLEVDPAYAAVHQTGGSQGAAGVPDRPAGCSRTPPARRRAGPAAGS